MRRPLCRLLAGLLCVGAAQAQETIEWADKRVQPPLRVSGFGSLGVSHVDAPAGWGFRRELNQTGGDASLRADVDTRLGVQVNYTASARFELVAQAIIKKRGAQAVDGDTLEWAYLNYRPAADWALRLGRVNVDAFLMADYRNVGYGYTMARPQVELYSQLPTTLDGVDVARSWLSGDAQWRVKLMYGGTRFGDVSNVKANELQAVAGGMVSREEGGLLLRASYARGRIQSRNVQLQPALAALGQLAQLPVPPVAQEAASLRQRLDINGIWGSFTEIGARHESVDWQWSAEVVRVSAKPLTSQTSMAFMLGRRIGDWTPYAGYGRTRTAGDALQPPAWAAVLTPVIGPIGAAQAQGLGTGATLAFNASRLHQSSWSLGARWDFHPQAALKLQWDDIRVSPNGSALWSRGTPDAGHGRVATAVVDFIF